jgi:hypothetical protein
MVLNILDGLLVTVTTLMLLVIAGLPADWLLQLADLGLREFQWVAPVVIALMSWLIYVIATADRAADARRDD